MKILAVIHASFEPLGAIQQWIDTRSYHLTIRCPYRGESLPPVDDFDFLIVMGGPQSPLKIDQYPYLQAEIDLIREAIQANKRVLGVCLGAQLIGQALGADTEVSPNKEIGVWPIRLTQAAKQDPLFSKFPDTFDVAHWHNDMPGLPDGAVVLAESDGCPRQIIRFADHVYGFQCHLEMTLPVIERLCEKCADDLAPGKYIQTRDQILQADYNKINEYLFAVLPGMVL